MFAQKSRTTKVTKGEVCYKDKRGRARLRNFNIGAGKLEFHQSVVESIEMKQTYIIPYPNHNPIVCEYTRPITILPNHQNFTFELNKVYHELVNTMGNDYVNKRPDLRGIDPSYKDIKVSGHRISTTTEMSGSRVSTSTEMSGSRVITTATTRNMSGFSTTSDPGATSIESLSEVSNGLGTTSAGTSTSVLPNTQPTPSGEELFKTSLKPKSNSKSTVPTLIKKPTESVTESATKIVSKEHGNMKSTPKTKSLPVNFVAVTGYPESVTTEERLLRKTTPDYLVRTAESSMTKRVTKWTHYDVTIAGNKISTSAANPVYPNQTVFNTLTEEAKINQATISSTKSTEEVTRQAKVPTISNKATAKIASNAPRPTTAGDEKSCIESSIDMKECGRSINCLRTPMGCEHTLLCTAVATFKYVKDTGSVVVKMATTTSYVALGQKLYKGHGTNMEGFRGQYCRKGESTSGKMK